MSRLTPSVTEDLKAEEKKLLEAIGVEQNPQKKEDDIFDLALFYVNKMSDASKARPLAQLIHNREKRFTVELASWTEDSNLSIPQQIEALQNLKQVYPGKVKMLEHMIQTRNAKI